MLHAIVSDIHGNLPALQAVLADARECGATALLNLGDICSGPLWPKETLALLMPLELLTIAGNHERQMLAPDRHRMGPSDRFAVERLGADDLAVLSPDGAGVTYVIDYSGNRVALFPDHTARLSIARRGSCTASCRMRRPATCGSMPRRVVSTSGSSGIARSRHSMATTRGACTTSVIARSSGSSRCRSTARRRTRWRCSAPATAL